MNRIALVTGSTGEIGSVINSTLQESGYTMINTCRSSCDITDLKHVRTLADKIEHLDILVNNAAISEELAFDQLSPEMWKNTIDVNLTGVFNMLHVFLEKILKSKHGRVINISSSGAIVGEKCMGHYMASKAGIIGLTSSLAKEYQDSNTTFNTVLPSYVTTQTNSDNYKSYKRGIRIIDSLINKSSDERQKRDLTFAKKENVVCSTPEDVAHIIKFLCSKQSQNINGQVFNI